MHHLVIDLQWANPLGHHRHRFDMPALGADPYSVTGGNALLLGQHLADFDELLRLGNGIDRAMLGPEVEVFGQPVAGRRIREVLGLPEGFPD
ncbi:hypothetical protein D3C73_1459370 [compost metagenome]